MNIRPFILGAVLLVAGLELRASKTNEFYVKVSAVNEAKGQVETRFVVVPDNIRLVCEGDVKNVFVGDYQRVDIKADAPHMGKLTCNKFRWYIYQEVPQP